MIEEQAHICEWILQYVDNPFYKIKVYKRKDGYFLEYRAFASEQAIIDGEADYVGKEMSCISLRIAFCPFCGKQLSS
jgi:hypothetical protein